MTTPTTTPPQEENNSNEWLNWQSEALQAYTDWKIVVSTQDGRRQKKNETAIYNVHRLVLAASPRKSGYFCSVFQTDMVENKDNSSHIVLDDALSAELFPRVLDFIYSNQLDVQDMTDEAKLCLFSLADYFDIPTLKAAMIQCCVSTIQESSMEKTVFYLEQTDGSDNMKELFDAAIRNCAERMKNIRKNVVYQLKPQWLVKILQVAADEGFSGDPEAYGEPMADDDPEDDGDDDPEDDSDDDNQRR